jgi:hypothetical protein
VTKECVLETEDWFFSWKFERIDGLDFCEVIKEDVLERNAYWKLKRLQFNWGICEYWRNRLLRSDKGIRIGKECDWCLIGGFKPIGGIDFCEVTKECVLEMEVIGV